MRRILPFLLALLLCAPLAAHGEETSVAGYVMDAALFHEMEAGFRDQVFGGEVGSIDLTDTQTLLFTQEEAARMLPSVTVMIRQAVPLVEDVDSMVLVTQSLLEHMQALQAENPDAFLFNTERAMAHVDTGFHFAVAEVEVWLWAQDGSAVMMPLFFYDGESGELIDGVYLLTVAIAGPESAYYALYSGAEQVVDYLMCVEMASDQSDFQRAVIEWYLSNFGGAEDGAADADGGGDLGSLRITVDSGHAREAGEEDAARVGTVRKGEVYPIEAVAESGWYEIRLADGTQAYISPALGERVE